VCPSPFHASLRWILGCWAGPPPTERRRAAAAARERAAENVCLLYGSSRRLPARARSSRQERYSKQVEPQQTEGAPNRNAAQPTQPSVKTPNCCRSAPTGELSARVPRRPPVVLTDFFRLVRCFASRNGELTGRSAGDLHDLLHAGKPDPSCGAAGPSLVGPRGPRRGARHRRRADDRRRRARRRPPRPLLCHHRYRLKSCNSLNIINK
jgi:hypothetical protein